MIARTPSLYRIPVAFFSMKHFRCRQKHTLTPDTIREVFARYLDPHDRLLRQSHAGGGSTRVLVLDSLQQVKGVYHPLLCLPHPSVLKGGDHVLGLPVEDYLKVLRPEMVRDASIAFPNALPTVLVIVSHPHGMALTSFTSDGKVQMPLMNFSLRTRSVSDSFNLTATPAVEFLEKLVDGIEENYERCFATCSTYYFIAKDGNSSVTLVDLKNAEEVLRERSALKSRWVYKMFSSQSRWITLPDTVLQTTHRLSLYVHDEKINRKVVSAKVLSTAVTSGSLELDVPVRHSDGPSQRQIPTV